MPCFHEIRRITTVFIRKPTSDIILTQWRRIQTITPRSAEYFLKANNQFLGFHSGANEVSLLLECDLAS